MKSQDVAKSPQDLKRERDRLEIVAFLRKRSSEGNGVGCFLCKWIVEDFELFGTLTDYPKDYNGHGVFPYRGKAGHIKLELATLDTTSQPPV